MDLVLNKNNHKTQVYLTVGQMMEISIPAHPKTGQLWNWTAGFDLLDVSGSPLAVKHGAMISVMQKWRFRAKKVGNGVLRLSEAHPGDMHGSQATFEVKLTISADPKAPVKKPVQK